MEQSGTVIAYPEDMNLEEKFNKLKAILKKMDKVLIALSGGVDSTFLLKAASISSLSEILAVTGLSESLPEEEALCAKQMTDLLDIRHMTIITKELDNKDYADNPPERCYYCKKELFSRLRKIADKENIPYVLDGTNADDADDWRPGSRAAREEGVRSPLLEADLGKEEIRRLSHDLGLSTWKKPATPCLASRFPYGQRITVEALERVHRAEKFIKQYGVKDLRVRHHSDVARIELMPEDFEKVTESGARNEIVSFLKSLGFRYIALDLQGFRSGSSNEALEL